MSLRAFRRLSCKLVNLGGCGCEGPLLRSSYCSPSVMGFSRAMQGSYRSLSQAQTDRDTLKSERLPKPLTMREKLVGLWRNYGVLAVGTYLGVYVGTLGGVFVLLDAQLLSAASVGVDPAAAIQRVCDLVEMTTGLKSLPGYIRENPRVGTFALAWALTKLTEPLRLGLTLAVVPSLARWLRARGLISTPAAPLPRQ
eukprot:gene35766-43382_t